MSTPRLTPRSPQERVVAAAGELFTDLGYAATSVRSIARAAGVSLDTVYASGGKADLFLRAMETVLSGTADGTPLLEAPGMAEVWSGSSLREVVTGLVEATVAADVRATRIWPAFVEGAGSDAVLSAALRTQNEAMRAEGRRAVGILRGRGWCHPDIDADRVADLIWAEAHPDRYQLLVVHAGWSVTAFQAHLVERILELLTRPTL